MNFLLRCLHGIKDGLRVAGFVLASMLLPTHGKRLIFIASLYCYVARLDALQDEALAKLNIAVSGMSLASHGHALRLPAAVRDVVWGAVDVQSVLDMDVFDKEVSPTRAQVIAENVVAMSPRWVRYRTRGAMVDDVKKLIADTTNLNLFSHAA